MKEVIFYYYGVNALDLKKINNGYSFTYKNNQYLFIIYNRTIEEIKPLFLISNYLIENGIFVHQFIFNIMNDIITIYNDALYVMLKINISSNRYITIDDIISFNIPIRYYYQNLIKNDWYNLWTKKIDYLENQITHLEISEPILVESINYFIGLGENAISYFKNINVKNNELVCCHRRVKYNDTLIEFLNPLNIIIDYRVRDPAEYFKSMFMNDRIDKKIVLEYMEYLDYQDYELFYTRMLFPTHYFDKYDEIINGTSTKSIIYCIDHIDEYEEYLSFIYYFLSERKPILEIPWLNK